MWQPAHVDGRTLVILRTPRPALGGHTAVEAGRLSFDGETLRLIGESCDRAVNATELASLQAVTADNRIAACRGFDFFLLREV